MGGGGRAAFAGRFGGGQQATLGHGVARVAGHQADLGVANEPPVNFCFVFNLFFPYLV